ncbi:MAG: peptidoglycan bridge formation glycyltransferase FemA/FemB family protein [candidate division KSB1 bacterium]|nr:peptidoglycan bridge formation glycyltransferase FemA/FemB family protein [candidate division KSB1 bacterium]
MQIHINEKRPEKISKTPVLQQTAFWAKVKRQQGIGSQAFDIQIRSDDIYIGDTQSRHVTDDVLVLLQSAGQNDVIGYVPYGPTLNPDDENQGLFLEELSETLRPNLPDNCVLLRYDLRWESPWAKDHAYFDANGIWTGPPSRINQEIRVNFGTENWNLKKANTNVLPPDTVFIDLLQDEEELIANMKPKTRYNIRLSGRRRVRVRRGGISDLELWYRLYRQTAQRNHICLHDLNYFQTVLNAETDELRSPANVELLIAEKEHEPLAAMFLVFSGRRATYLYGASSSLHRNAMPTYALQWHAIKRAKQTGCRYYDMFGIAPKPDPAHPLYGLYRFKTGFGGNVFHRMGCWDYPLNERAYDTYRVSELNSQGYHLG